MNYELVLQFSLDVDNNNYKCTSEQQLQSTDSATAAVVVVYFHRIQVVPYTSRHIVHTAVPYCFILFEVDSYYSSFHSYILKFNI